MAYSPLNDPLLPPPTRPRRRGASASGSIRSTLFQLPLLLLGGAIALFSFLIITERFASPDELPPRGRPDLQLDHPYSALGPAAAGISPMQIPAFPRGFQDSPSPFSSSEVFDPEMDPTERLLRLSALLGDRKTAWLSIDHPVRLLEIAHRQGIMPRGPLVPLAEHIPLLLEQVQGPVLLAFDNRIGGWTLIVPTRDPYVTMEKIARDTGVELSNLLTEEGDRTRRIMQMEINPRSPAAQQLPAVGTLWIITHEGLGGLYITNNMFESRRFLSSLARGIHTIRVEDLPNREVLEWPISFSEDSLSDDLATAPLIESESSLIESPLIQSRFVLMAPAAAANTTANSEALRVGEWLLGVRSWDLLRGSATIQGDGRINWQLRAESAQLDLADASMVGLLGAADAGRLMAHLPAGASMAVAIDLESTTRAYDAWREHLITTGFPDGAEGLALAERDLALSLGFWIRESMLPLLGQRFAVALYGRGEEQTWMVVAEARDVRSVERMIASADARLSATVVASTSVTRTSATRVALNDDTAAHRPRAWKSVGNTFIVTCGPLAESLLTDTHHGTLADAFSHMPPVVSPLRLYMEGLPLVGVFSVEDGALVMQGSALGLGAR